MFVIMGNKKINSLLKKYLNKQKIKVLSTISPDYLIVNLNKEESLNIPAWLKDKIKIKKIDPKESISNFLEDAVYLKKLINQTNGKLNIDDKVKIIKGNYTGFSGIVKEVNKNNCKVEFTIFNKKVEDYFSFDEIEKL